MTERPDAEVEARAARLLDYSVGENLDHLATLDLHGDDLVGALYRAARHLHGDPLALGAARALRSRLYAGDRVLLVTGFLAPLPETDGLIGAAVLALALERALGVQPIFVAEGEVLVPVRAALRAAGLNPGSVLDTDEIPHAAV
ncbi:MAG: glutamate cyclase domain-containing protein, partial [Candidatus Dormiibacterota bacterium]